ncbi:TetR/AcrR family transcriptional regulator [Isoptericola aurantiacus]|uniref:TetR/AcrR family transcriptional regulator n=1 Tax=Isoptericola aurantiacus TaxID=3377839 RepID=UPI00383B9557
MPTHPTNRAAPMAPDDRRAAIVEAVLPLVAERGTDVTSRELADAAGVAEGTLFRAFGDKSTLVATVASEGLSRAASPARTRAEIAAIDLELPLADRLARVVEAGRSRAGDVMRWLAVLRRLAMAMPTSPEGHEGVRTMRRRLMEQRAAQRAAMIAGVESLLAPDTDRLRVPVDVAVALLEAAISGTHGHVDPSLPVPSAAVVADALVHGIVTTPETPEV